MNSEEVATALALDAEWVEQMRHAWLALVDCAVFGDVASTSLGATTKLRRRVLELGERQRSLASDRAWIPSPREQLKNALASALALHDAHDELGPATRTIDRGEDRELLVRRVAALDHLCAERLTQYEARWAALLDSQYREERGG